MAEDNKNKSKSQQEIHEENRKKVRGYWGVPSLNTLEKRGIKDVDIPIRPGASADSSGYFAKEWRSAKKERADYLANRKGYTLPEMEKMEAKSGDVMDYLHNKVDEAKGNYHRQKDKMDKSGIIKYDKDGYAINPLSSKKEIKPAAIVAPVKRPSEAVMKKLTGK
jgi:hypothetical protein